MPLIWHVRAVAWAQIWAWSGSFNVCALWTVTDMEIALKCSLVSPHRSHKHALILKLVDHHWPTLCVCRNNIHSVRTSNAWFRPLQEIHWKPLLTLWHNPPRHSVVVGCVNPTYSSISQEVHVSLRGQQRVQRGLWLCQMLRHRSLNQVDIHSEVVWGKTAFRPSSLFNYFCFQVDFWFAVLAP